MSHLSPGQTPHDPQAPQGCGYVLHGLNTNPARMDELAQFLQQKGLATTIGQLTGHSKQATANEHISAAAWKQELAAQWMKANENCLNTHDQRVFIGYSLGALTAMNIFDSQVSVALPTKMILLSPALNFRYKAMLIRSIAWLPFGNLPSLNHQDYRARDSTPLKSYRALFALQSEWKSSAWKKTSAISALVVLSKHDELVDSQALVEEINKNKLDHWKVLWLTNDDSTLQPRYHHLMIDQKSMGSVAWNAFTEALERQLGDTLKERPTNPQ